MAKLNPQHKATALQVAAALATGISVRGVLPSDKAGRNTCLTALRLTRQMDQVVAMVEENEELMTLPLDEAHGVLHKLVLKAAEAAGKEKEVEDAKAAAQATLDALRAEQGAK